MNKNTPIFAYIHGFNSDKSSRSYKELNFLLGNVLDFHYSYIQPAPLALKEIENKLLSALSANKNIALIGSSLGGFFALFLAHKYSLPCTAFNPVTFPHEQLAPFTGKNYNFYTNKEWDFTQELLLSYKELPLSAAMPRTPNIILGVNDTTIDPNVTLRFWKKKANIFITEEEHSIADYKKYLPVIQNSIKNQ